MDPTIQFKTSVGRAFDMVTCGLKKQGFRVVRSFDLQEAASAHIRCTCPFHGTADCTCQYLVAMAYPHDPDGDLFTFALHSDDEMTFVSLIAGDESEWINVMVPLAAETTWQQKGATMSRETFTVPNISCGHCTHTIQTEVGELPGVKSVRADVDSKQVVVEWDDPATWEEIEATLKEINYAPAE